MHSSRLVSIDENVKDLQNESAGFQAIMLLFREERSMIVSDK